MNSHLYHCREQLQTACFSPLAFDGSLAPTPTLIHYHKDNFLCLNNRYRLHYDEEQQRLAWCSWDPELYSDIEHPGFLLTTSCPASEHPMPSRFVQDNALLPPFFVQPNWQWGDTSQRSFLFSTLEDAILNQDLGTAQRLLEDLDTEQQCMPRALYLRGVFSMTLGDCTKARFFFHRAAQSGNLDAYLAEQRAFATQLSIYYAQHPGLYQALQQQDWERVLYELSVLDQHTLPNGILTLRALREQRQVPSYQQIVTIAERTLRHDILVADALIDYWNLLLACRKDRDALHIAQLLYQLYPIHAGSYRALTISNLILGRYEQAYIALHGMLLDSSQEYEFLELLTLYEDYSGNTGLSQKLCQEAAQRTPSRTELQILHHQHLPVASDQADPLERLAAVDEKYHEQALLTHCDRLIEAGLEHDALKLLRTALLLDQRNLSSLVVTRCSSLLRKHHHPELAYELWRLYGAPSLESTFSDGAKPLLEFACTLVEHGEADQGMEHIRTLHALFPEERCVQEVYSMLQM